ncbi:MAG: HipA N-terminal domain-containing protein [Porphyromonadaceae bacterium]|nr:HipA N-terminal domain-containing protein [Porphyromonadaceae bacterium]
MRQLNVFVNDSVAGILTERDPGAGYVFCYEREFLSSDFPPISVTMPKRAEPFESERLFPVFTNLLPEGFNRKVICRSLNIDEGDFFGLLYAMAGKDFIGAVEVRKVPEPEADFNPVSIVSHTLLENNNLSDDNSIITLSDHNR